MSKTIILFFIFCLNISFATFQEVRIGTIDEYYKSKISKEEMRKIIDEIEYVFENKLNMNIFDYSQNGKEINIVYLPPSKTEKIIETKKKVLKEKKDKIDFFKNRT